MSRRLQSAFLLIGTLYSIKNKTHTHAPCNTTRNTQTGASAGAAATTTGGRRGSGSSIRSLECSLRSHFSPFRSESTFNANYHSSSFQTKDLLLRAISSSTPVTINILTERRGIVSDETGAPLVLIRTPSPPAVAASRSSSQRRRLQTRQTQTSISDSDTLDKPAFLPIKKQVGSFRYGQKGSEVGSSRGNKLAGIIIDSVSQETDTGEDDRL